MKTPLKEITATRIHIINERGVPFIIKIIRKGERYGLDDCLVHKDKDPLIEFYDARQNPDDFDPEGQFVSRYCYTTLTGQCKWSGGTNVAHTGINLQGDVPSWQVDAPAMAVVMAWLANHLR